MCIKKVFVVVSHAHILINDYTVLYIKLMKCAVTNFNSKNAIQSISWGCDSCFVVISYHVTN